MNVEQSYRNQREIHRAITSLYKDISERRRPFAPQEVSKLVKPTPSAIHPEAVLVRAVKRDQVIAALMSKAARTEASIALLCDSGLAVDAYTLCRVLLENLIIVAWLLCEDENRRNERIDTYVLHYDTFKVRVDAVGHARAKSGAARSRMEWADERAKEISKEVFDDKWMHWAWMSEGQERSSNTEQWPSLTCRPG